jgi:heme/copper-type cytochrome/quinol oxidase subunit 2
MRARLKSAAIAAESASLLIVIMFFGSLVLWVGVPVAWLWIGSQIQPASGLATAIGAMMIGMLLTIALLVTFLAWVNRKHVELQEARGSYGGQATALELVLVASAVIAVLGFGVWFFGFSGSSPIPLNISY